MYSRPGVARRGRHRAQLVLPVAFGGVRVQIAAQIRPIDEMRQGVRLGRLDLAAKLAQLGSDPLEAERRVNVLLALAGNLRIVRDPEHSVFVEFEPEADRPIAKRDVVRLGPGEILQCGAATVGGDQTQVCLEAAANQDARLGVAMPEHALDFRIGHEFVHQRRRRPRRQQIQIPARVAAAAQAADRLDDGFGRASVQK